jgi:hypothetical protein
VLTAAFAELANAPITNQWIDTNYPSLLSSLMAHLSTSSDPELICSFFDIHSKLVESYQIQLLTPEVLSQLVAASCATLRVVTGRSPSNAVMFFVILLYSLDSLRDRLSPYVPQLTQSLLLGYDQIHSTSLHHAAVLIGLLRTYQAEFQQGAVSALNSEAYGVLSEGQKTVVYNCLIGLPSKPITYLKQLSLDLNKILRRLSPPDILVSSEAALVAALHKAAEARVIDLT